MFTRAIWLATLLLAPASVWAQPTAATAAANPTTICESPIPPPRGLPPAGSGPVIFQIAPCFEAQGNISLIDIQTYLYYIQLKPSLPSQGTWVPFDEAAVQTMQADFKRLWGTNFLDNVSIQVSDPPGTRGSTLTDFVFSNGVVGKLVVYHLEERQRVKIVDYTGSKKVETTKIDEALKTAEAQIRLDTFIDPGLIKKVEGIVRDLMKEKGFQFANVTHEIKELPGGPKLVHLTFNMDEGPKVKIRNIEFVGNSAVGDRGLKRHMKQNKEQWFLSFISGRGLYQENKFDEDAERVTEYYRDKGYVKAVVGQPELKFLQDSDDKATRWVELRIPVTEGKRYKVGNFNFAGNTVVKGEALRPLFKVIEGEYYNQKRVRQGLQKAQELYGARWVLRVHRLSRHEVPRRPRSRGSGDAGRSRRGRAAGGSGNRRRDDADSGGQAVLRESHHFHRQYDDARQRDSPRDAAVRGQRLQYRGAEVQHPASQSARLLQTARRTRQGRDVRQDAECRGQGGRPAEARRTEPQPADLRRRRVAVRRVLRPAVVPDGELPRPRREPHRVAAGRLAGAELHAGVHRAVPLRPQHHRRRQSVPQ